MISHITEWQYSSLKTVNHVFKVIPSKVELIWKVCAESVPENSPWKKRMRPLKSQSYHLCFSQVQTLNCIWFTVWDREQKSSEQRGPCGWALLCDAAASRVFHLWPWEQRGRPGALTSRASGGPPNIARLRVWLHLKIKRNSWALEVWQIP